MVAILQSSCNSNLNPNLALTVTSAFYPMALVFKVMFELYSWTMAHQISFTSKTCIHQTVLRAMFAFMVTRNVYLKKYYNKHLY